MTDNKFQNLMDEVSGILQKSESKGEAVEELQWVDGINKMLTDKGILFDNTRFENVSVFKSEGVTCILYPFEDVHLDISKLAMWRLQSYTAFAGMWLSDYGDNNPLRVQNKPTVKILSIMNRKMIQ